MNPLWSYLWPALLIGLIVGVVAGSIGFRTPRSTEGAEMSPQLRRRRAFSLGAGAALSLAAAALWHGPFGGADRFSKPIERGLHNFLVDNEMTQVTAKLHHDPLTRDVLLSGRADDFQRSELVRLIDQVPGVRSARWSAAGGGLPLIVEGCGASILGFLLGLLLAYLVELRRRYNSQWNW
jgi:hypothetical protein